MKMNKEINVIERSPTDTHSRNNNFLLLFDPNDEDMLITFTIVLNGLSIVYLMNSNDMCITAEIYPGY